MIFRKANISDIELYFDWINDPLVREQSYNSKIIDFESHKKWFEVSLRDKSILMLIFQNEENQNIGQVRFQKQDKSKAIISISVDSKFRGKGYSKEMLELASDLFLDLNSNFSIYAFVKLNNLNSRFALEKAGFEFIDYSKNESLCFVKHKLDLK